MSGYGVIILAAGGSTRLGQPKQLVRYGGRSLLERTTQIALAAGSDPVVIVLGAELEKCRQVVQKCPVQIVKNTRWREGLASSLRAGIEKMMTSHVSGVVILLCDQIKLTTSHVQALRNAGGEIVASVYAESRGAPLYFDRRYFGELCTLQGDTGARDLLRKYSERLTLVSFPEGHRDVDTPEDLKNLSD